MSSCLGNATRCVRKEFNLKNTDTSTFEIALEGVDDGPAAGHSNVFCPVAAHETMQGTSMACAMGRGKARWQMKLRRCTLHGLEYSIV